MKKEMEYATKGWSKEYLCSLFRSLIDDIVVSASTQSFVKIIGYEDYIDQNPTSEITEDEYYAVNGFTLNVPTYSKGMVLNSFFVDMYLKPYLKDKYMKSNYVFYYDALLYMINNPEVISDFYEIEENQSMSMIGKTLKIGHLENKDYDDTGLEFMFNFDFTSDDTKQKPLDRIRRSIIRFNIVQTNVARQMEHKDANDALLSTGTELECNNGNNPSIFKATSLGNWATSEGKAIATVEDLSKMNIGSFGHCKAKNSSCNFSASSDGWQNSDSMTFAGKDTITEKSYIYCVNGGLIKVKSNGQNTMKTNTKGR